MRLLRHYEAVALSTLLLFVVTAQAKSSKVYRCAVDGRVVLQDVPCPTPDPVQTDAASKRALPIRPAQTAAPASSPEELRRRADEISARHAREREELQKGFRTADTPKPEAPKPPVDEALNPSFGLKNSQICRTAILVANGHPISQRTTITQASGITHVAYVRDDGKEWSYKCRIAGNRVHWGQSSGAWYKNTVLHVDRRSTALVVSLKDVLGSEQVTAVLLTEIP